MTLIEKYVQALLHTDYQELADLFTDDGKLVDYCPGGLGKNDFHCYGRESIEMFFHNKFAFRLYSISGPQLDGDSRVSFYSNYAGQYIGSIATIIEARDGKIAKLIVRPA